MGHVLFCFKISLNPFLCPSMTDSVFPPSFFQSHPLTRSPLFSQPAPPVQPVVPAAPQPVAPVQPSSGGSLDSMLGLLQSDLSRQGVQTSSKGNCSACQKPVVGQVCLHDDVPLSALSHDGVGLAAVNVLFALLSFSQCSHFRTGHEVLSLL